MTSASGNMSFCNGENGFLLMNDFEFCLGAIMDHLLLLSHLLFLCHFGSSDSRVTCCFCCRGTRVKGGQVGLFLRACVQWPRGCAEPDVVRVSLGVAERVAMDS